MLEAHSTASGKDEQISKNKQVVSQLKKKCERVRETLTKQQKKNSALIQLRKQMKDEHKKQCQDITNCYNEYLMGEQKYYHQMKLLNCECQKLSQELENLKQTIQHQEQELECLNNKNSATFQEIDRLNQQIIEDQKHISHMACMLDRICEAKNQGLQEKKQLDDEIKRMLCDCEEKNKTFNELQNMNSNLTQYKC